MICFNLSGRFGLSNSFYRSEEKVVIRQKYKDTYLIWDQFDSFSIKLLPHNQHLHSCWIILPREFIQDVCDAAHHRPWQHGEDTRSPYVYIYTDVHVLLRTGLILHVHVAAYLTTFLMTLCSCSHQGWLIQSDFGQRIWCCLMSWQTQRTERTALHETIQTFKKLTAVKQNVI